MPAGSPVRAKTKEEKMVEELERMRERAKSPNY